MMLFTNVKNKVARWKRQFIFVHDIRTKRVNNKLATYIFEWRTAQTYMNYPTLVPCDVDLKNALLDYVKEKRLVDLEALVTLEQLATFGFVDTANLYAEGNMNRHNGQEASKRILARIGRLVLTSDHQIHLGGCLTRSEAPAQHQGCVPSKKLKHYSQTLVGMHAKLWILMMMYHLLCGSSLTLEFSPLLRVPLTCLLHWEEMVLKLGQHKHRVCITPSLLWIGNTPKATCNKMMAMSHMLKLMDSFEMANKAASAKSRAEGLVDKVNELKEELEKAQAERERERAKSQLPNERWSVLKSAQ
ncbi:hypothetical protein SLEP1_g39532 [Rubroshorea leprosula]|uniref:Uncharacterized protein n=1 Tax=Rubroshorea leprosula TaxID=152421 RepID=A0AAV5L0X3_9ROSI|nr:hypothetical protein SLEP1_g39532 [Rubroshorea leprosula]